MCDKENQIGATKGQMMRGQNRAKLSRLNIRIDYDLKDKIEREAKEANTTYSNLVLDAVKVRMERKLLVKKELAKWKRETQVDLRNWEHRQYYISEEFRLNCLHGVLPASKYDNPDSGLRKTKLEDLNKPTVVAVKDDKPTVVSLKDEEVVELFRDPFLEELQEQLNEIDARMKSEAPVYDWIEDENTNTDRNDDIPKVKSISEMIKEKMDQVEDSLKDS